MDDEVVVGLEAVGTTPWQDTASADGIGDADPPACGCATCKGNATINSPVTYTDKSKYISSLPICCYATNSIN